MVPEGIGRIQNLTSLILPVAPGKEGGCELPVGDADTPGSDVFPQNTVFPVVPGSAVQHQKRAPGRISILLTQQQNK